MIKGFYTAKASLIQRQKYTNLIGNNIANVNTVGYKKDDVNFGQILANHVREEYHDLSTTDYFVGGGAKICNISKDFTQGSLIQTDNMLDIALNGTGFLTVVDELENVYYTRVGNFSLSHTQSGLLNIVTKEGYTLVNSNMRRIEIPSNVREINICEEGLLTYQDNRGSHSLRIVSFSEDKNLEQVDSGIYFSDEIERIDNQTKVKQGYLEMSNIDLASEMVELITNQRLFGMNSKVIQTVDEMSNLANNLRR